MQIDFIDCDNFVTTQTSKSAKKSKFKTELDKFSRNQLKTDKRNRLDPEKVNIMMVVEDYYKFDIKK